MKSSCPWAGETQSLNSFQRILNSASERDIFIFTICCQKLLKHLHFSLIGNEVNNRLQVDSCTLWIKIMSAKHWRISETHGLWGLWLTWRYLSCSAAGDCSMICEASLRAFEALISPSAAITFKYRAMRQKIKSGVGFHYLCPRLPARLGLSRHRSLKHFRQSRIFAEKHSFVK